MTSTLPQELLTELKKQLENKQSDLEAELKILNSEDSFNIPDRTVGNAEDADEANEDTTHLETQLKRGNVEHSLGLVEKALAKMDAGEYGVCEVGGEQIDPARLRALPEAETCLDHADQLNTNGASAEAGTAE